MPRPRAAFLLGLSLALLGLHSSAEDPPVPPKPAEEPRLKEILHDDFQTDTRKNYEIKGDVAWEKGRLTLSESSSFGAKLESGPWAQWQFDLDPPTLEKDGDQASTLLRIKLEGASDACVKWYWTRKNAQTTGRVQILESIVNSGKESFVLVRDFTIPDVAGPWKIEYRYGHVSANNGTQSVGSGYVEYGTAFPTHWKMIAEKHSVDVHGIQLKASPRFLIPTHDEAKALAEAIALNESGEALYRKGRYAQAEPLFVKSQEIIKHVLGEEHLHYVTSLNNLAGVYYSLGAYDDAERLFVRACEIAKRLLGVDHPDYAASLTGLALLHRTMGAYDKAELLYVQARDINRQVLGEDHPAYGAILNQMARLFELKGDYAKAEPLYIQSREVRKRALGEAHPKYAETLNYLAGLYASMGEYAKSEPLYVQARDIDKRVLGDVHPHYALSLNNLARLYELMGEYAQAEPLYVEALGIFKRTLGEHPDYAKSLNNLAGLYYSMKVYSQAEPLYVEARDIFKRTLGEEHPDYAQCLDNLALLYISMGDYAKAESLLVKVREFRKRALGEEHSDYAIGLNNLAGLYHAMGAYDKAEPLLQTALNTKLTNAQKAIAGLSETRSQEFVHKNVTGLEALLSVGRRIDGYSGDTAYAAVWKIQGLVSKTLRERRRSIGNAPEAQKLFADLQATQQQLAQWTLMTPSPSLRARRTLRVQELDDEKERLESALANADAAFQEVTELEQRNPDDLKRVVPDRTAVVHLLKTRDWEPSPTGKGLGDPTEHYEVFILTNLTKVELSKEGSVLNPNAARGGVAWVHLGRAAPIETALAEWREQIQRPDGRGVGGTTKGAGAAASSAANTLRKEIWSKIEPHLAGCKSVIVIPAGDLHFLPWGALPGSKPGTYLIEEYAIATAQDGRQLYQTLTAPALAGEPSLLLVGGVDYDQGDVRPTAPAPVIELTANETTDGTRSRPPSLTKRPSWPALAGTTGELEQLTKLAGMRKAKLLRGSEAQENTLRQEMPKARFIHLATHGFFADESFCSAFHQDEAGEQLFGGASNLVTKKRAGVTYRNPLLLSGIVLAGANQPPQIDTLGLETGQDGILTAEEVVNLDLQQTELVVLSACETGLGRVGGGEGVFGLQRAFALAGARTTVASLWKVDDAATQTLMAEFYRNLWERKLPKLEALRQAQLTMLRRYDPQSKQLRERNKEADPLPKSTDSKAVTLPPYYWAAFTLGGDWR